MGITVKPSLVGITGQGNKNKHSVSFVYDWSSDTSAQINVGGIKFKGSQYTLDISSLASNVADLPAFRTLLFTQEYDNTSNDHFDGELLINISGVGQILRFGGASSASAIAGSISLLTASIPIVANAPTKITFSKGENAGATMFGKLTASIYDFDLAPYSYIGYANDTN